MCNPPINQAKCNNCGERGSRAPVYVRAYVAVVVRAFAGGAVSAGRRDLGRCGGAKAQARGPGQGPEAPSARLKSSPVINLRGRRHLDKAVAGVAGASPAPPPGRACGVLRWPGALPRRELWLQCGCGHKWQRPCPYTALPALPASTRPAGFIDGPRSWPRGRGASRLPYLSGLDLGRPPSFRVRATVGPAAWPRAWRSARCPRLLRLGLLLHVVRRGLKSQRAHGRCIPQHSTACVSNCGLFAGECLLAAVAQCTARPLFTRHDWNSLSVCACVVFARVRAAPKRDEHSHSFVYIWTDELFQVPSSQGGSCDKRVFAVETRRENRRKRTIFRRIQGAAPPQRRYGTEP